MTGLWVYGGHLLIYLREACCLLGMTHTVIALYVSDT